MNSVTWYRSDRAAQAELSIDNEQMIVIFYRPASGDGWLGRVTDRQGRALLGSGGCGVDCGSPTNKEATRLAQAAIDHTLACEEPAKPIARIAIWDHDGGVCAKVDGHSTVYWERTIHELINVLGVHCREVLGVGHMRFYEREAARS